MKSISIQDLVQELSDDCTENRVGYYRDNYELFIYGIEKCDKCGADCSLSSPTNLGQHVPREVDRYVVEHTEHTEKAREIGHNEHFGGALCFECDADEPEDS